MKKAKLNWPLALLVDKSDTKYNRKILMTNIFFYTMHYTSILTGCQCFVEKKNSLKGE